MYMHVSFICMHMRLMHFATFDLYLILGGDQMTSARVRGSQRIRSNSERGVDRLQGVVPVTEDWHAKMCFLEVHV